MNTATPQDTFDHTLGSGLLSWPWWRDAETTGVDRDGNVADDWTAKITADDGDNQETIVVVDHAAIMRAARKIIAGDGGQYVSDSAKREARALIFDADECDFDASTGDELLQVAVLGQVIFG
jgi:hypothetical protein